MGKLSDRIENLAESETIAMARMSRELQEKGVDVISLSLGEPDFLTPDSIREDAKKAIDEGYTHYPPISGYKDLRIAIKEKFEKENGLQFDVENIVVSTGAKQSLANAILSLVNPGDEVLVPVPYWVSYVQMIRLAEGRPVLIPSGVENDYKITPEQLRSSITPKTRLLIFSSPCNPSGTVYTKEELEAFAQVLADHPDIMILSDEIYEHINFIGKHESIAQFNSIKDRVAIINGVSKAFAMTGWRIGYIAAPVWLAKACDRMQGQFTSGASSIAQRAALSALRSGTEFIEMMAATYLKRRDLMLNLLSDIPGLKLNIPMGAFYIFPDVSEYFGRSAGNRIINSASELCMYILEEGHVGIVPGEAFGEPSCIRISYATSDDKLAEAASRLKDSLLKLT